MSIRKWWIEAIKIITFNDSYPYIDCDLTTPKSIFIDQTENLSKFKSDLNSGELSRLLTALDNEKIMNVNVLCPFGCTEFCFKAEYINLDVILQRYLLDTILP